MSASCFGEGVMDALILLYVATILGCHVGYVA